VREGRALSLSLSLSFPLIPAEAGTQFFGYKRRQPAMVR